MIRSCVVHLRTLLLSAILLSTMFIQPVPASAQTIGPDCTEEFLRNIGVVVLSCAGDSAACAVDFGQDMNPGVIWNFLIDKNLSPPQAAGILGNIQSESGGTYSPRIVEYGYLNSRGEVSQPGKPSSFDDNIPPNQPNVDDGSERGQPGYGLVQWTATRKDDLAAYAESVNQPVSSLTLQLEFLWEELNTTYKTNTLDKILATNSAEEASDIFLINFERPADIEATKPVRRDQANNHLATFGAGGIGSTGTPVGVGGCSGANSGIDGYICPDVMEPHPNPSLKDYFKLPDAPNGEYSIYSTEARRYGSQELVCVLYTVGLAFHEQMEGRSKLRFGDLNADGHSSHNRGIAVDLSGYGELQVGSHIRDWKGTYDTDATILLGKMFADTGLLRNIWWCDPGDGSEDAIRAYAEEVGLEGQVKCIDGHSDHFHVDILAKFRLDFWEP